MTGRGQAQGGLPCPVIPYPHIAPDSFSLLAALLVGFNILGLARAWDLLGAHRYRFQDLLKPTRDVEKCTLGAWLGGTWLGQAQPLHVKHGGRYVVAGLAPARSDTHIFLFFLLATKQAEKS